MEEVELFAGSAAKGILSLEKLHSAEGSGPCVLGKMRFTLPNHSRRHQKLTSPQSFALKSDQQGSAGSHVFNRSLGFDAVASLKLCWIGCVHLSPLTSAR
jgi:hypothetical protein